MHPIDILIRNNIRIICIDLLKATLFDRFVLFRILIVKNIKRDANAHGNAAGVFCIIKAAAGLFGAF